MKQQHDKHFSSSIFLINVSSTSYKNLYTSLFKLHNYDNVIKYTRQHLNKQPIIHGKKPQRTEFPLGGHHLPRKVHQNLPPFLIPSKLLVQILAHHHRELRLFVRLPQREANQSRPELKPLQNQCPRHSHTHHKVHTPKKIGHECGDTKLRLVVSDRQQTQIARFDHVHRNNLVDYQNLKTIRFVNVGDDVAQHEVELHATDRLHFRTRVPDDGEELAVDQAETGAECGGDHVQVHDEPHDLVLEDEVGGVVLGEVGVGVDVVGDGGEEDEVDAEEGASVDGDAFHEVVGDVGDV